MFQLRSNRAFDVSAGPLVARVRHCVRLAGSHALDALRVQLADDEVLLRQLTVYSDAPNSSPDSATAMPLGLILDGHLMCDWSACEREEFRKFCAHSDALAALLKETRAQCSRLLACTESNAA